MPSPTRSAEPAVLSVHRARVEWLDATCAARPTYAEVEARGERPADLAEAAAGAVALGGGRRRPCVLALSDALVSERLVHLPRMPRRELRLALARKAAHLLGVRPRDVYFSAALVDPSGLASETSSATPLGTWLLSAAKRAPLTGLRSELRRRGFRVRRVVPAVSGALCRAASRCRDAERASIAVTVERSATTVALIAGPRLFTLYRLAGDFLARPTLGATLIQDLRNCAGFWRRTSRGGTLERVVLQGLDADRGEPLAAAVEAALGTPVDWRPSRPELAAAGRLDLLEACRAGGPFAVDLTTALPPSPRTVAGSLAAAAALALGAVGLVHLDTDDDVRRLELEADGLARRATEVGELEAEVAAARARVDAVGALHDRAAAAERLGAPLDEVLAAVERAFAGRAVLLGLDVERVEGAGPGDPFGEPQGPPAAPHVRLRGTTAAEPVAFTQALSAAVAELGPLFEAVAVVPPSEVPPLAGDGGAPDSPQPGPVVPFTVEATLAGGRR